MRDQAAMRIVRCLYQLALNADSGEAATINNERRLMIYAKCFGVSRQSGLHVMTTHSFADPASFSVIGESVICASVELCLRFNIQHSKDCIDHIKHRIKTEFILQLSIKMPVIKLVILLKLKRYIKMIIILISINLKKDNNNSICNIYK